MRNVAQGPAGLAAHVSVLLSQTFIRHLLAVERRVTHTETVQPS